MTEEFEDWHYRTGLSVNDLREQRRAFWELAYCAETNGSPSTEHAGKLADEAIAWWDKRWGPGGKEPVSAPEAKR